MALAIHIISICTNARCCVIRFSSGCTIALYLFQTNEIDDQFSFIYIWEFGNIDKNEKKKDDIYSSN